jgi:hypothetical protein
MDNTQLFIAVAVPSLLVLVNILSTRRVESRLDELTTEVSDLRVSLANLRAELYEKFTLRSHA